MTGPLACRIRLQPSDARPRTVEAFTTGVALPRGWCRDASTLRLVDGARKRLPIQTKVLERWSDGSVRWVLLDFQSPAESGATIELRNDGGTAAPIAQPVTVRSSDSGATVTTGDRVFVFAPGGPSPLTSVTIGGLDAIDPRRTLVSVRGRDGRELPVRFDRISIEEHGPLRAAIVMGGEVQADVALGVTCRVELFAGQAAARIRVVLHNPRAARHPGGFWELGDDGSVLLQRVALEVAAPPHAEPTRVRTSLERGTAFTACATPFLLHQESSGKERLSSAVHVNREGRVPLRYAGYRLLAGAESHEGTQACPVVIAGLDAYTVWATSRLFWEVFPKAYSVSDAGVLGIELLPAIDDCHELQGGERFTHELTLGFGDPDPETLEAFRSPSTVVVDPEWWAVGGDPPCLTPLVDPHAPYERLVSAAIEGEDTFRHKHDRIDEYGWRHYGDLYADHENGPASDRPPIVSHYNNQYDAVFGLTAQFMRSGDARWWHLARDLATHVAHIDIYWTDADKSAYNGGQFWHTSHYVDAGRSTHRCYPRAAGVAGGGPSVEQNYSTGLLFHYLLTGDPASREAVLRLARWTVDMDDGGRTVFRFLSRAPTGLASATGTVDYHGPGRGPANAIQTFLNAYRLTADREWIRRAEALIARAIHPADDLEARTLLDAERRWHYTVFLQALGRYLAIKSELGEEDAAWHYARASLLHYARWMAVHEYPYLDKPDILEHPTETWAAQDMRKCEALDLAARYAIDGDERSRFVERAQYFFDTSTGTLSRFPTRTWTRPVVLMLSYGYAHVWHVANRDLPLLPASSATFGKPRTFEPQRAIALRRAKTIAAGSLVAVMAAALAWWL